MSFARMKNNWGPSRCDTSRMAFYTVGEAVKQTGRTGSVFFFFFFKKNDSLQFTIVGNHYAFDRNSRPEKYR